MKHLLDTCAVSDFARGDIETLARVKASCPEDLAMSSVSEMEIRYGLSLNPGLARRLETVMNVFFESVHVIPYDRAAARQTVRLRAALKSKGTPIGAYNALIAGTALAHGLILVTSNSSEFERIDGLSLEGWRRTEVL